MTGSNLSKAIENSFSTLFGKSDVSIPLEILGACPQIHLNIGEYLFHQGDASSDMFIVLKGRLRAITT
ncbi:MAG: cyclic nucleotide-binding domain-containing protein, partial [Saprospiraceae bacterium]|nr:cyclic nucleotide-binding domain-containing protein [Saprospiraceae bacterium]